MDNSALFATVVANRTLGYFRNYMNLARTVSRNTDFTSATHGETVTVGKRGDLAANDKTAGNPVTVQSPAATGTDVTLSNHKEVTFDLEDVDVAKLDNPQTQDLQEGYAQDAAGVLIEEVEDSLAALYASISASAISFDDTDDASKVGSLLNLRQEFTDAKVPKNEQRFLYMGSRSTTEVLESERLAGFDKTGEKNPLLEGAISKRYGFGMFESQAVVNTGTAGTDGLEHNVAYTRNGIVLATRPLKLPSTRLGVVARYITDPETGIGIRWQLGYNKSNLAEEMTLDILYGVAVLDQRRVRNFNLSY